MPNSHSLKYFILSISLLTVMFSSTFYGQNKTTKCVEVDYDQQIAEANKGIEFSTYNIKAYLSRSYAYLQRVDYDNALKDFNRVIELSSEFAESYEQRATVYDKIGEKDKAEADRQKYLELSQKQ